MQFMSKNTPLPPQSVDGFRLRRRQATTDVDTSEAEQAPALQPHLQPGVTMRSQQQRTAQETSDSTPDITPSSEAASYGGLLRSEIDESLSAVDTSENQNKKREPKRRFRRIGKKKIALIIFLLIVAFVGYFAVRALLATSRVFSGNVFEFLGSGATLQKDANGRTNILVFGTSEDDPSHDGASLTDSIMVVSIDQEKKTAAMVSMPRDLWVDYDLSPCCFVGCSGKINAIYECYASNNDATKGSNALKSKVGEIFGMDIQYYVKVNYTVVRQLTTALGGVTVTVESTDPRGLYDYNTKLKVPNGPVTLEGEQALAFVRARGDGGGYGFEGSNFVREQNQQKMMIAIRDKALSAGTLSNPAALVQMMDALGDNIRTNFSAGEVKTLAKIGKDISGNAVTHINLNDGEKRVVTTGTYGEQSIVKPVAGLKDFSGIQAYIKQQLSGGDLAVENASVEVLNASNKSGIAKTEQTKLQTAGVVNVTTSDTTYITDDAVVWYDLSNSKLPKTQALLQKTLGSPSAGSKLPAGVQSTADFVILVGNGFN